MKAAPSPDLDLCLQLDDVAVPPEHRKVLRPSQLKKWVKYALVPQAAGRPSGKNAQTTEITVRVVGLAEGRQLNRQFRGQNHPTNVLTFDFGSPHGLSADLVLCAPVVQREAVAQGKSLKAHYAHLLIHGTLHAQGYEHDTCAQEAEEMEALEMLLMLSLGFDNPYQD
ncbi:MAG: rRNA maturation RNase YbeY [Betaproteobacteria bacterium]|nr:rRNA maturation RNase YbeY [Betaproteobacteria bacterium]